MTRREFPTRIKVAIIKRATRENGETYCEACGAPTRRWQIDHINPDGLTGEPILANAQLICDGCYAVKNPQDTATIAKAKRREAARLNARPRPVAKIPARQFPQSERSARRSPKDRAAGQSEIARRFK